MLIILAVAFGHIKRAGSIEWRQKVHFNDFADHSAIGNRNRKWTDALPKFTQCTEIPHRNIHRPQLGTVQNVISGETNYLEHVIRFLY